MISPARVASVTLCLVTFAVTACREQRTFPSDLVSPIRRDVVAAASMWASVVDGETRPGTVYRLDVLTSWNGGLAVDVAGLVPPVAPVEEPAEGTAFPPFF